MTSVHVYVLVIYVCDNMLIGQLLLLLMSLQESSSVCMHGLVNACVFKLNNVDSTEELKAT